jgi:hypothetical protein
MAPRRGSARHDDVTVFGLHERDLILESAARRRIVGRASQEGSERRSPLPPCLAIVKPGEQACC